MDKREDARIGLSVAALLAAVAIAMFAVLMFGYFIAPIGVALIDKAHEAGKAVAEWLK